MSIVHESNIHRTEVSPELLLQPIQRVQAEWLPLVCGHYGCQEEISCHDCERCAAHCPHHAEAERLGFGALMLEEDRRRAEFLRRPKAKGRR